MIVIDVAMPQRCADCFCSIRIREGHREGRLMCNAMEKNGCKYVLVDEYANHRPEDCPIRMEIVK